VGRKYRAVYHVAETVPLSRLTLKAKSSVCCNFFKKHTQIICIYQINFYIKITHKYCLIFAMKYGNSFEKEHDAYVNL
jgi:hypothetical protein